MWPGRAAAKGTEGGSTVAITQGLTDYWFLISQSAILAYTPCPAFLWRRSQATQDQQERGPANVMLMVTFDLGWWSVGGVSVTLTADLPARSLLLSL